jgi:hypothetical protein
MLGRMALVTTDVSEERRSSIIRVIRINELGTTLAETLLLRSMRRLLVTTDIVPSSTILVTVMMEELLSYGTSILTRATRSNIPEAGIIHNDRRENLKTFIALTGWFL